MRVAVKNTRKLSFAGTTKSILSVAHIARYANEHSAEIGITQLAAGYIETFKQETA